MPNDAMGPRLSAKLRGLTALLFILYALVAGFAPVMDNVDLGWHVAQGRWMVQHLAFYRHDVFNYPNLGHPVIDEYPLFQVVLFSAWSLGWWGPCLLTSLVLAGLIIVLLRGAKEADAFLQTRLFAALGMMLLLLHIGSLLRPHLVTYLCLATLGAFLIRHRDLRSWTEFWPMALVQVAWTNCHSAFVIGPAMVALFGVEVTARRWRGERALPRATALTWLGAFLLMLLACLVNPDGFARFQPPFVQEHLESIRAYVGEMEPLPAANQQVFFYFLIFFGVWFVLSRPQWRGLSLAFILLAAFFFHEALDARKAWPVFGVMLPLIVLSERAFAAPREKTPGLGHLAANFVLASCLAAALVETARELPDQWRELAAGRSEMSHAAIAWMKAHGIQGKLFHRCEDGGLLQMEGFTQTFSDTGFGKFDEAFIHETGLVNERPALVPRYLYAYRPDFVICSNFCYEWPFYLNESGWILVDYTPNSSIWEGPDANPPPDMFPGEEIEKRFDADRQEHGLPAPALLGREIIALQSLLRFDFAYAKLTGLPAEDHQTTWYWEAARILCFEDPPFSSQQRDALMREAETLQADTLTADFRAHVKYAKGDVAGARQILSGVRTTHLSNSEAELLLKIDLEQNDPAALALARRTNCWDLRNGKHWQYLAEAEERWGSLDAARVAWRKAVFYYPDDGELMNAAGDFAARHNDAELAREIADSEKIYGAP